MSYSHIVRFKIPQNNTCDRIPRQHRDGETEKIWSQSIFKLVIPFDTFKRCINDLTVVHSDPWEQFRQGGFVNAVATLGDELTKFDLKPWSIQYHGAEKKYYVFKIILQSFKSQFCGKFGLFLNTFTQIICIDGKDQLLVFLECCASLLRYAINTVHCRSSLKFRIFFNERFNRARKFQVRKNRFQCKVVRHSKETAIRCKRISNVSDKPANCDQSTQTSDDDSFFKSSNLGIDFESQNSSRKLQQENDTLKCELRNQKFLIEKMQRQLESAIQEYIDEKKILESEISSLKETVRKIDKDRRDALDELGHVLIKNDSKTRAGKKFQEIFPWRAVNDGGTNSPESSSMSILSANASAFKGTFCLSTRRESVDLHAQQSNDKTKKNRLQIQDKNESDASADLIPFPVEVIERSNAESIGNPEVLNAYKQLLLIINYSLLLGDVAQLKNWASQKFSFEANLTATEVIINLDGKGVISASDLSVLRVFFESIIRIDLVYLIDEFSCGHHTLLRMVMSEIKTRNVTKGREIKKNSAYLSWILTPNHCTSRPSSPEEEPIQSESNQSGQFNQNNARSKGSNQHDATCGCSRNSQRVFWLVENRDKRRMHENSNKSLTDRTRRENGRGWFTRIRNFKKVGPSTSGAALGVCAC